LQSWRIFTCGNMRVRMLNKSRTWVFSSDNPLQTRSVTFPAIVSGF
jgi:hypothetical protein